MKNYLLLKAQKIMKVCLFSVACVFLLILMLIKPMRVALAHQLPFLSCQGNVCVDDPQQQEKAQKLYNQAIQETQRQVGNFHSRPTMVFCSIGECAETFGMEKAAAKAVGNLGTIIAPRGWEEFYIVHELIHDRQAEEWGNLAMLTEPKWLIEGMAYTLSNDPRPKLSPPFEQWRIEFKSWYRYHHQDLWQASKRIKSD